MTLYYSHQEQMGYSFHRWIIQNILYKRSLSMSESITKQKERSTTEKDFLTVEEVAAILRVCSATVRNKVKAGLIPCLMIGAAWRIPKKWIDEKVGIPGGGGAV